MAWYNIIILWRCRCMLIDYTISTVLSHFHFGLPPHLIICTILIFIFYETIGYS